MWKTCSHVDWYMRKFAHTMLGTLETWTSRLGKFAFSDLKNVENFLNFARNL